LELDRHSKPHQRLLLRPLACKSAQFGVGQEWRLALFDQLMIEHLSHLFFLDGSRAGLASADSKVPKRSSTSGRSEYLLVPIGTRSRPTALSSAMWWCTVDLRN